MGKSSTPSVTPTSTLTGSQQNFLSDLLGYVEGAKSGGGVNQVGIGVTPYGGQLTPAAQPLQTGSWDLVQQMLQGNAPGQTQAQNVETSIAQPWDPTFATNEWTQAIQAPAMQNWNQNLLPSILEKYAGSNAAGGGNAAKAVTDEAVNLQTGLESNLASTLLSDKTTSNNQALTAGSDLYGNLSQILTGASGGGTQQYGVQSSADTAAQQNWSTGQPYNNPWLSMGLGGTSVNALENVVSPSIGQEMAGMEMGTAQSTLAPCCFIFTEANGGTLDPIAREYRDALMTPRNRRGYYRLAEKLVPWMRKSKLIAAAVKGCMVNPMMKAGKWYRDRKGVFPAPSLAAGFFWLAVYDVLGSGGQFKRSNGELI